MCEKIEFELGIKNSLHWCLSIVPTECIEGSLRVLRVPIPCFLSETRGVWVLFRSIFEFYQGTSLLVSPDG
jgi:hypothetical protein